MSAMNSTSESIGSGEAVGLNEAIQLIWREADLLDSRDYQGWLKLWTRAGRYIVPIARDDVDPEGGLNIAYDDAAMREARVQRLSSGLAMSATPAARTVRTISRFVPTSVRNNVMELRCAQQLVEYKNERTRILAADMTYRVRRLETGLAIDEKVVRLINSDDALFGIGYLL